MSLEQKINDKRQEVRDSLKGGWWLPNKNENVEEWVTDRPDELVEEFTKPMIPLEVIVNDKQKEEYKNKNGESYLLKFYDLDKMQERYMPVNGNLDKQISKLILGLEDKKYNDLTEEEKGLINEKAQIFEQVSDLTKNHDKEDLACIVTYWGKTSFDNSDQDFHTYSIDRLDLTAEDIKMIEEKTELPF